MSKTTAKGGKTKTAVKKQDRIDDYFKLTSHKPVVDIKATIRTLFSVLSFLVQAIALAHLLGLL